jgi:hypothetical protein
MIRIPHDPFHEIPDCVEARDFLGGLRKLRGGLYFDLRLLAPWTCDPERCRPKLGPNLCCKVQIRCKELVDGLCAVHDRKPFGCALFPADLVRVAGARAVVSAANPDLYRRDWTRFDRDMLRCFEGADHGPPLYESVRPLLRQVFTRAEYAVLEEAYEELRLGVAGC